MNPTLLPAQLRDDAPASTQTLVAFLATGSRPGTFSLPCAYGK